MSKEQSLCNRKWRSSLWLWGRGEADSECPLLLGGHRLMNEKIYKKIVLEIFPNTKIIDTTNINQEETIELIINDKNFMKDM